MTDWLSYWLPDTFERERGRPLNHAASEQFGKVDTGDTVWFVTIRDGYLRLIGRLEVDKVVGQREAERILRTQDLWPARYHLIPKSGTISRATSIDISGIALELRFEGTVDRLKTGYKGQAFQSMRRLTPASAMLLRRELTRRQSGEEA